MQLAPTAALREALKAEWDALWMRWKQEVLYDAGTHRRAQAQQYEALGRLLRKEHRTAEERETMGLLIEAILRHEDLMQQLAGEPPDPEQELIERLTQAHEAVHPTPQPDAEA